MWVQNILIGLLYYFSTPASKNSTQPEESGQALVEYAIIMVFVAVLVIVLLSILGPAVYNMFSTVYDSMVGAQG